MYVQVKYKQHNLRGGFCGPHCKFVKSNFDINEVMGSNTAQVLCFLFSAFIPTKKTFVSHCIMSVSFMAATCSENRQ